MARFKEYDHGFDTGKLPLGACVYRGKKRKRKKQKVTWKETKWELTITITNQGTRNSNKWNGGCVNDGAANITEYTGYSQKNWLSRAIQGFIRERGLSEILQRTRFLFYYWQGVVYAMNRLSENYENPKDGILQNISNIDYLSDNAAWSVDIRYWRHARGCWKWRVLIEALNKCLRETLSNVETRNIAIQRTHLLHNHDKRQKKIWNKGLKLSSSIAE